EYINEYNSFLAGELSAVEMYDVAIRNATKAEILQALTDCRTSHRIRAEKLSNRVRALGGTAKESGGIWGAFAKFVQSGAATDITALGILEQAEAERLVNYESQTEIVVGDVLEILQGELLPAQHESHLVISALLQRLTPVVQTGAVEIGNQTS